MSGGGRSWARTVPVRLLFPSCSVSCLLALNSQSFPCCSTASRSDRTRHAAPFRRQEFVVPDLFLRMWIAVVDRVDRSESGQTTAEYALVLIAAAAIAGLVLAWATKTHAVSGLFDNIVNRITNMVG